MTRLTSNDLFSIEIDLSAYDQSLVRKTGLTLKQIAVTAAGIEEYVIRKSAQETNIAVVPITVGEGIIDGFTKSVFSIIKYLGFKVLITKESDVCGIAESVYHGSNSLFMADDNKFIALNINKAKVIDNAEATGWGYAAALNAMAGGLTDKEVIVIGAGNVGLSAITYLKRLNSRISVFDVDINKVSGLNQDLNILTDLYKSLPKFKYIFDATPQKGFLQLNHIDPDAMIAAPGIPLGLDNKAYETFKDKLIHDPLQIGVATMLAMNLA